MLLMKSIGSKKIKDFRMKRKAVLIGINYYDISGITLNGCINDIINIRTMLTSVYGYDTNNIMMLSDNSIDTPPTKKNIINAMCSLVSESSGLEEIWIHYSGHGSKTPGHKTDEVLVPLDFETNGYIIDNDLLEIINDTKCRTIIVTDCCHSEAMFELPWSFEYIQNIDSIVSTHRNNEDLQGTQIFMYSGCKDKQTSSDIYNRETGEFSGAFTSAFIRCLIQRQYTCSFLDLYKDVFLYLQQHGYSQIPIFSSSLENPDGGFLLRTMNKLIINNTRNIIRQNMLSIINKK